MPTPSALRRLEDLPPLPEPTTWLLVALLLVFWLAMRIRILRRRQARRRPEDGAVETWGWLARLAAMPRILPLLAVVATLLGVAILVVLLLPR